MASSKLFNAFNIGNIIIEKAFEGAVISGSSVFPFNDIYDMENNAKEYLN